MKILFSILLILFGWSAACSQALYSRSFGNPKHQPIIFLHGGPGSSSVYFEATTAKLLADKGFFVIIYDRRGEGRSKDSTAKLNFNEAFADLSGIYKKYNLRYASLIGFSFGGLIATQYAQMHPGMVRAVVLCSALISQQKSYETILSKTRTIYEQRKDTTNLNELTAIAQLNPRSFAYRTLVFRHASANGFFTLSDPDHLAKRIYATYKTDTLINSYLRNESAVHTFWQNENQVNIDVTPILNSLRNANMPIFALYGKQDGLYSDEQVSGLKYLIGNSNVKYLDRCSHTVFIDQQSLFLSALSTWLKKAK
ncbi:alpha/beta fold hydrolase [Dyadobacter fermentans]|uniref:Alpha/beta hydrolase fold protein n=1 Tax=Dyadobacter fermentans (strain ATCC 700827 / DSM 18053 / CIP 107007 / KCTC 52180 / NS114) TaxID=471854 RepID=C6VUX5_DYAFD|nr:alpha/beta hydrolase [Dyadobacter fermentans]ACT93112.1 alpha/beta hydrolase fold protein [Dyadobacter fermentans DSM 18053]